jgi:hypothetical protein
VEVLCQKLPMTTPLERQSYWNLPNGGKHLTNASTLHLAPTFKLDDLVGHFMEQRARIIHSGVGLS